MADHPRPLGDPPRHLADPALAPIRVTPQRPSRILSRVSHRLIHRAASRLSASRPRTSHLPRALTPGPLRVHSSARAHITQGRVGLSAVAVEDWADRDLERLGGQRP